MNAKAPKPTTMALWAISLTLLGLVITVIIQTASTAYAFGTIANEVKNNQSAIIMLVQQNKRLTSTDKQVAILRQKVIDDEELLHAIARAVGAKDGGVE